MLPKLVQEENSKDSELPQDRFLFAICQHGTEPSIKEFCASQITGLRFAFSRPGLLTFKWAAEGSSDAAELEAANQQLASFWAVRAAGRTLCNVKGNDSTGLLRDVIERYGKQRSGPPWDGIHVYQRDAGLPGENDIEPGPTELSNAVATQLANSLEKPIPVNQPGSAKEQILDIVIVEPDRWLVGSHEVNSVASRYPGGAIVVPNPAEVVSRAYFKIAEALLWSELPVQPGDKIVEIGSSPGGSCQRLLDLGLRVTGVDPAEMDPLLLQHDNFEHWRSKAAGVRRKRFAGFKWLTADANVAPNYTLDVVEDIVTYKTSQFRGILLTLKLSSYGVAEQLGAYLDRIRSWGFSQVAAKQLSTNRRECTVVATR